MHTAAWRLAPVKRTMTRRCCSCRTCMKHWATGPAHLQRSASTETRMQRTRLSRQASCRARCQRSTTSGSALQEHHWQRQSALASRWCRHRACLCMACATALKASLRCRTALKLQKSWSATPTLMHTGGKLSRCPLHPSLLHLHRLHLQCRLLQLLLQQLHRLQTGRKQVLRRTVSTSSCLPRLAGVGAAAASTRFLRLAPLLSDTMTSTSLLAVAVVTQRRTAAMRALTAATAAAHMAAERSTMRACRRRMTRMLAAMHTLAAMRTRLRATTPATQATQATLARVRVRCRWTRSRSGRACRRSARPLHRRRTRTGTGTSRAVRCASLLLLQWEAHPLPAAALQLRSSYLQRLPADLPLLRVLLLEVAARRLLARMLPCARLLLLLIPLQLAPLALHRRRAVGKPAASKLSLCRSEQSGSGCCRWLSIAPRAHAPALRQCTPSLPRGLTRRLERGRQLRASPAMSLSGRC